MVDSAVRVHFAVAFDLQKSPIHLNDADVVLFEIDEAARYGEAHLGLYTNAERNEIAGVKTPKRRCEKLAGKLAAKVLARELLRQNGRQDCRLEEIEVIADQHPVRVRHVARTDLDPYFFSISHTDGLACAAASACNIGLDVERVREITPELHATLVAEVGSDYASDDAAPLFVFTQKEAVLKAAGIGLERGLDGVQLQPLGSEAIHEGSRYQLATAYDDQFVLSIARLIGNRQVRPSRGQEGIWFLHQLADQGATYNLAYALEMRGALKEGDLRRALERVVLRHEPLRTTFSKDRCRAYVSPPASLVMPMVEVTAEELPVKARQFAQTAIPLDDAPLLKTTLFRVDPRHHVLAIVVHHIAFDAASQHVLLHEIASHYADDAPALPPLEKTFATIAASQPAPSPASLAFWKKQLAHVPRVATSASPRGGVKRFPLPPALAQLSQEEGVTLFATLLAAFQTLLARWTGETDLVIGVPFQGRAAAGAKDLIGYFVNTLPVRVDLTDDPTFAELLQTVRNAVFDAFEHQHVPIPTLVETVHTARGTGAMPLFRFVAQALHTGVGRRGPTAIELPGLTCRCWQIDTHCVPFDLVLTLENDGDEFIGKFEYRLDAFPGESVDRMIGHLQRLLDGAIHDRHRPISMLPILSEDERRFLAEINSTETTYPRNETVADRFERYAAQTPHAIAVIGGEKPLTYRELNERANQLAHELQARGVQTSTTVACLLERPLDIVVSLLGILKAGGAYLALSPGDPADRVRRIAEDANAHVVITCGSDTRRLSLANAVCLEDLDVAARPTTNPRRTNAATDVAYVTYTSGSTGQPKGVAIPHRAIMRLLFGVDYAPFGAGEVFLQLAPVSFDASTFELWGALLHGAAVVLYESPTIDPRTLEHVVTTHGVTCMFLTTALFNTIMDDAPQALTGLRCLIFGGELVSVPHVRRALEHLPNTKLVHAYGPTEATTFTCCYAVPREIAAETTTIPIGRPIANTSVYILDRHRSMTGIGCVGELYVGGDALALGYVGAPTLTADRFIDNPFRDGRLYRTGDRARVLPSGDIEFVGRVDQQIKLRGFRVEPGEIEAALAAHGGVGSCAVLVCGSGARKTLVAHVQTRATEDVLRRHLAQRLPAYMIPKRFVRHETLPLTANGKIDRRALAKTKTTEDPTRTDGRPLTLLERVLIEIWEGVLGVDDVDRHDDFFERGGHSLLAVTLAARIEQRFGIVMPLAKLFAAPTVAALATVIHEHIDVSPVTQFRAGDAHPPLFLVPGAGGHSFSLRVLARLLGEDQPSYGLQYPGVDGKRAPCARVETLAAAMVDQIKSVQSNGPYFLGGFSLGGMVAQEAARQLAAGGDTVAHVALLDPTNLHRHHGRPMKRNVRAFRRRWYAMQERLRRRFAGEKEPSVARFIERVELAAGRAEMRFAPGHYRGKVTLFRSGAESPRDFWVKQACDDVEEILVPGAHLDIIREPHVNVLAQRLRESLQAARANLNS